MIGPQYTTTYDPKDPKAIASLLKDQETLLTFHDFPMMRRHSVRTVNLIEKMFVTISHWKARTKECATRGRLLHMRYNPADVPSNDGQTSAGLPT